MEKHFNVFINYELQIIYIGFVVWDPRNMPEYVEIGDNCIVPKHKGNGYGKLQLQEAINEIIINDVKKNEFSPQANMKYPRVLHVH